ncbi:MAG TPA: hypothetical protein DD672_08165, partial [Gammaproteobacteria bacterium]|nr:hypothetical protein [Gammaproteobacteria bacterium]
KDAGPCLFQTTRLSLQRQLKFPEQRMVQYIPALSLCPMVTAVELYTGYPKMITLENGSQRLFPLPNKGYPDQP